MRTAFLVACIVSASLLLPNQAVAAGATVTADLDVIVGNGQLESAPLLPLASVFSMQALSFVADVGARHISVQKGKLILNAVKTHCVIGYVAPDCSLATLHCEDNNNPFHEVIPGGPGVGSIDAIPLATGLIHLVCEHLPPLSR